LKQIFEPILFPFSW